MTAAVDLPAWTFMVAAVIGLTVSAVHHLIGRRTVRRVTQLRRRQLDAICAHDQLRRR